VLALRDQEEMRAQSLADHGGPETLVHGDLWPKNVIVQSTADGLHVRLIDWDRVGVGSFTYDLSTFLSRFPAADRMWILDSYRRAAERAGWHLPAPADLNVLFSTAELARLTNRVIWPAIAVSQGHTDRAWAFGELESIGDWIERDQPLLPV
jgi:Ser/Thr protein kinase RdoA (MazF antagonist)